MSQRLGELREAVGTRLNEVDRSKVNKEWFLSEEFQTMLFEAARQVTATADRKKIKMLGNALANSGIRDFQDEDRKELFLQIIRDLTPQHIAMLRRFVMLDGDISPLPFTPYEHQDLLVLQMLHANGLVTHSLKPPRLKQPRFGGYNISHTEATQIMNDFFKDLQKPAESEFQISAFGADFLKFVSMSAIRNDDGEAETKQNDQTD
jgi:hypothetical protein